MPQSRISGLNFRSCSRRRTGTTHAGGSHSVDCRKDALGRSSPMPHMLSDLVYYRADLRRIAPLTREEEAMLVGQLRLARQGLLPAQLARQARQRLVEGNQPLVVYLARKYHASFRRLDLEDLIQEGNLAPVQATQRCPYRWEAFSGYASLEISKGITHPPSHDSPI